MNININKPWNFFLFTFAWSWTLWTICVVFGFSIGSVTGMLFYILGALAPSSVGIVLARFEEDKEYWNDFVNRITDFKRIQGRWYIVLFGLIPATVIVAILINYLIVGDLPSFTVLENYLTNPLSLIAFSVATLIGGPIFEELGWRGYGLDHLTKRYSLIRAGLIATFFWIIWHWPLFMIKGTLQSTLVSESLFPFLSYNIEIFSYGVLIVWIYANNSKSILSAVLFHFSINFFAGITNFPARIRYFETFIQLIVVIIILFHWNANNK